MKKKEGKSTTGKMGFIMGGNRQSAQLMMDGSNDVEIEKSWLMSIRKVMQRPDVNRIQILSWLRGKQKQRTMTMSQQKREWSRFMSGYVGSNANANDIH